MRTKNEELKSSTWDRAVAAFEAQIGDNRLETIREYKRSIVEVVVDTPLGCVELHHGLGRFLSPLWILITMLGEEKVAVPVYQHADHICRPLITGDPICYGKWYPFSLLNNNSCPPYAFVEGDEPGMLRKGRPVWKLRCYAPDGSLTWVPIPRFFSDADAPGRGCWGWS